MELRPHQTDAIETMWAAIKKQINSLMVCPCSFGKSLVLAKLTQRLLEADPSYRVMYLVDREVLVSQLRDGIVAYCPELADKIGIVCASVTSSPCHDQRITIASRQSVVNHIAGIEPVQAIIADECHLYAVPRVNTAPDQFARIVLALREKNSRTRFIGCTATPYRLSDGYIYGSHNKPGSLPYWEKIDYECKVAILLDGGYVSPLIGKVAVSDSMVSDLSRVGLVAGDYNIGQLDAMMTKDVYLTGAVDAWKAHLHDRKKTAMFCVSIEHAEAAAQAFSDNGIPAIAVHSKMSPVESFAAMESLKNGSYKVYTSVGKLTTGMDVPDIDAIILARPTKSTALAKQILGRGMRLHEGKENCYVIDMVGITNEFGTDLDRLRVVVPKIADDNLAQEKSLKKCVMCQTEMAVGAVECPECGYIYEVLLREAQAKELRDIEWARKTAPVEMGITYVSAEVITSKKSGKRLLRLMFTGDDNHWRPTRCSLWICFPGDGYTQYACKKGKERWSGLFPTVEFPNTADEAITFYDDMSAPLFMVVDKSGEYPEIKNLTYRGVEK